MNTMQAVDVGGLDEDEAQAPEVRRRRQRPGTAYQCRNLDDVRSALQYQFQTQAEGLIPEEVSCRLIFGLESSLEWTKEGQPTTATISRGRQEPSTPDTEHNVTTALSNFLDAKEKLLYQRAVARVIIGAISHSDGYKYSERRTNDTSKGDGYRFQYICRDSLQNKDRSANKVQTEDKIFPEYHTVQLKKMTYDCKGGILIKFSIKELCVDVFYHHFPIHWNSKDKPMHASPKKILQETSTPQAEPQLDNTQPPTDNVEMQPDQNSVFMLQNPFQQPFPSTTATHFASDAIASPQQDERVANSKKRKRKRAADSNGVAPAVTAGPSSIPNTLNIDTLVTVLDADINGTDGAAATVTSEQITPPIQNAKRSKAFNLTEDKKASGPKFRRAKTGCVTCRVRRIKCDEAHPSCVNCTKGRRDCEYPASFDQNERPKRRNKARGER